MLKFKIQPSGIIVDDEDLIICHSLPEIEKVDSDFEILDTDKLSRTEDGTIIRLYNYLGEWYTATKKCSDARKSIFSAKESFDELFWQVFEKDHLDLLNKTCTYIFVLKHVNNRLVIKHSRNTVCFITSINNITGEHYSPTSFENKNWTSLVYLKGKLEQELILQTCQIKIAEDCEEDSFIKKGRGLLIKRDDKYYMYDLSDYTRIKKLRGNTPDIVYRYIVFLKSDLKKAINLLLEYPEYNKDCINAKRDLFYCCEELFNMFITKDKNPIAFYSDTSIVLTEFCQLFFDRLKQKYPKYIAKWQFMKEFYYSENAFLYKICRSAV